MIGLSNQALSFATASPLLAVFDALPISMKVFEGLSVNFLTRLLSNGVRTMETERVTVNSVHVLECSDIPSEVDSILIHTGQVVALVTW